MLKIAKFGGSSVSDAGQFAKVKAIVESDAKRRVVVISAAGKRSAADHKLTDLLYLCHAHLSYGVPCDDIFSAIERRFCQIRDALGLDYAVEEELAALRARLSRDTPVDELVSRGEYFTARLMAAHLGWAFVDAAECVFFSYDGQLDREKTDAALRQALRQHGRMVVPGFYGSLPGGRIKVMSRGGSDITGALAAAAVGADVYENWTDVSGILMADPRIVPAPRSIATMTYAELREMAFLGAGVLHEEAIAPVKEKGIPLNIRNTNAPDDPGTLIVEKTVQEEAAPGAPERFITGVTGRRSFTLLTVNKHNMPGSTTLRQVLGILDRHHAAVEHITLGLDSFALVVETEPLGAGIYDVIGEINKSCDPDDVRMREGIALVAAVGRKMTSRPGISGRMFKALGDHGVNIRTIAQGADELSIVVGVENSQFETAIRVLYDGFAG